jgi:hypothetical protein
MLTRSAPAWPTTFNFDPASKTSRETFVRPPTICARSRAVSNRSAAYAGAVFHDRRRAKDGLAYFSSPSAINTRIPSYAYSAWRRPISHRSGHFFFAVPSVNISVPSLLGCPRS